MNTNRKARGWWMLLLLLLVGPAAYVVNVGTLGYAATVRPGTASLDPQSISRRTAFASVAIHTSIGSCDVIDIEGWADGAIKIPTGVTAIAFYGCDTESGTYTVINSGEATPVAAGYSCTAGQWYGFPSSLFPHRYIKILATGGTGTAPCVFKS